MPDSDSLAWLGVPVHGRLVRPGARAGACWRRTGPSLGFGGQLRRRPPAGLPLASSSCLVASSCWRRRAAATSSSVARVVGPHRLGDLGQVPGPRRRHDGLAARRGPGAHRIEGAGAGVADPLVRGRRGRYWYRAVTPSSLNREATVPKTGSSSSATPGCSPVRASWRRTSRRASSPPRRSNLLMATASAKSSMSIFSSWDAAPNSGVMTYSEKSTWARRRRRPGRCPGSRR